MLVGRARARLSASSPATGNMMCRRVAEGTNGGSRSPLWRGRRPCSSRRQGSAGSSWLQCAAVAALHLKAGYANSDASAAIRQLRLLRSKPGLLLGACRPRLVAEEVACRPVALRVCSCADAAAAVGAASLGVWTAAAWCAVPQLHWDACSVVYCSGRPCGCRRPCSGRSGSAGSSCAQWVSVRCILWLGRQL